MMDKAITLNANKSTKNKMIGIISYRNNKIWLIKIR